MSKKEQDIIELSDYSHARLRTEMYLSSRVPHTQQVIVYDENFKPILKELTWVPALYTYFREALDNAADEVISHKGGNSIWISFDPKEFIFTVEDNGRGIPIDLDKDQGIHKATIALSRARAGRNFKEREEVAGTNGLGIAVSNFCSEFFKVEIHRDGKKFYQEFTEGSEYIDDNLQIKKPKITSTSGNNTGTKISFKPSKHVFETIPKLQNNLILPEEFIKSRVIELAICNPHIRIYYNDEKINVRNKPEQSLFGKDQQFIHLDVKDVNFKSDFFLVPNWQSEGDFVHSVVNRIPAFNGGSHIEAFSGTFYRNLIANLEKESKKRKLTPNKSDIQSKLLIYNITNMSAPNFDSQSKTRLINESAGTSVKKFLDNNEELYKNIIKKNKQWIDEIYDHCAIRTNKKDADELGKLVRLASKNKVPKLTDANGKDRSKCILVITEGFSAKVGCVDARDPEVIGALELKGKPMNVRSYTTKEILDNKELVDIMNSIGLQIGKPVNRKELRFGQVYIAHDADEDGKNIGALLINFFYHFWPELFSQDLSPYIYVFQTPFLIGEKGKERKYWYAHNYNEYDSVKHKDYKITRAKGLGTLSRVDWEHSLKHPELIPIVDDGKLKETLDLLFNDERADDRKVWMGI